jgi:hypothetical protein
MALECTQPLIEMNTRDFPGSKGRPAYKADHTAIFVSRIPRKYRSLDFSQPMGMHRPSGWTTGLRFLAIARDFPYSVASIPTQLRVR